MIHLIQAITPSGRTFFALYNFTTNSQTRWSKSLETAFRNSDKFTTIDDLLSQLRRLNSKVSFTILASDPDLSAIINLYPELFL